MFGGGIYGRITEVREKTFMVEVANGIAFEIARGAVRQTLAEGEMATMDEK